MQIISQFYNIIIKICFKDKQDYGEHIHVEYNKYSAIYDINTVRIIAGDMPSKQDRMIIAWIEIHKEKLKELWRISQTKGEYFKIAPLK